MLKVFLIAGIIVTATSRLDAAAAALVAIQAKDWNTAIVLLITNNLVGKGGSPAWKQAVKNYTGGEAALMQAIEKFKDNQAKAFGSTPGSGGLSDEQWKKLLEMNENFAKDVKAANGDPNTLKGIYKKLITDKESSNVKAIKALLGDKADAEKIAGLMWAAAAKDF